jgi:hypothetical protein
MKNDGEVVEDVTTEGFLIPIILFVGCSVGLAGGMCKE